MSRWEIRIPYRSRAEPLADVAHNCRHLPAEDAEVARRITLAAMCAGTKTAGELLDNLGWLDAAQRRTFIDIARTRAGFRSIGDVEARERSEFASRSARVRLAATYGKPLRLAYREGGAIVDLDEVEADAAAERARAASLEAQRAARRADRDADAQALRAHEAARDAQHASELPAHLRPRTAA